MPNYLFTSDQRISDLTNRIRWVAKYVSSGKNVSDISDKSDNNNASTLKFYYNLQFGTDICEAAVDNPQLAIRNFVIKFQYPNTRTHESLINSINEKILLAPLRSVVKILHYMYLDNSEIKSKIGLYEVLYYIFGNSDVYLNPLFDCNKVVNEIKKGRLDNEDLTSKIPEHVNWKQYERQAREMLNILPNASSCFRYEKGYICYSNYLDDKEFIDNVLEYNKYWLPSNYENFSLSNEEYISYMDTKNTPYNLIDFDLFEKKESKKITPILSGDVCAQYRQFITAIKTKPFLLLAGISGTGKSRIVRELARACWDADSDEYKVQKPRNFEMVQVKPNWHDSSELIGYVSRIDGVRFVVGPFLKFMVKAIQDPEIPYFLCLDEMNLAPVEQYFAEYLSVIESRKLQDDGTITTDPIVDYSDTEEYKSLIDQLFSFDDNLRKAYLTKEGGKRLGIPNNLIVVGTVNMDETTFSFSRKVLDRAMTIEMNEVDLKGGLTERYETIGKLGAKELIGNAVEGVDVYNAYKDVCDIAIEYLQGVNDKLEGTPFKIAYRTRNEVLLYVVNNLPYNIDEYDLDLEQDYVIARALDEITNMKILSRIEGDETKVSVKFLEGLESVIKSGMEKVCENIFTELCYDSVSLAKLSEMKKRLSSGYTSFWS